MSTTRNAPFKLNGVAVAAGERKIFDLPIAQLATHNMLTMPVQVINGRRPGPRLCVTGAIHGDELNGVEVIRRLLKLPILKRLRGTLVAVPIVNVHGFVQLSRYLPDRRDLNRSFPGSDTGSLTARVAKLLLDEVVLHCSHGIDLHTGAFHRCNLPQIRGNLTDPETERLAKAFNPPVILHSAVRDGSLREVAAENGMPMLLYEAGEALRFDEVSIRIGVHGVVNVMRALEMLPVPSRPPKQRTRSLVTRASSWVRAPMSGIFRGLEPLGARVREGAVLGVIADPFGDKEQTVLAPFGGVIIGRTSLPLINEGDALFHVARVGGSADLSGSMELIQGEPAGGDLELHKEPPIV